MAAQELGLLRTFEFVSSSMADVSESPIYLKALIHQNLYTTANQFSKELTAWSVVYSAVRFCLSTLKFAVVRLI